MRFALGLSIGFFVQGAIVLAVGLFLSTGASLFWLGFGSGVVAMALVTATAGFGLYRFFRRQEEAFAASLQEAGDDVDDEDNGDGGTYRPAAVEVLEDLLRNYRPVTPPLRVGGARNRARRV
jgi:hypothetical protein